VVLTYLVRMAISGERKMGVWCCVLGAVVVLAGCGSAPKVEMGAAHARVSRSETVCTATVSELLTIAHHETFDAYPIYARRLFAQGSQGSASALNLAVLELRRLKEPPFSLIHDLQAVANGFAGLARATRSRGRGGEKVSQSDYTKYDILSGDVVRACR
jgi:hypothetical protein